MKWYSYNGKMMDINQLSELSGIAPHTIRDRLRRGYSIEEAVKQQPLLESVKEYCNSSWYEDWIGKSISEVYQDYWRWCDTNGFEPTNKQHFSRQIATIYPMLYTVANLRGNTYNRYIRLRT